MIMIVLMIIVLSALSGTKLIHQNANISINFIEKMGLVYQNTMTTTKSIIGTEMI